MRIFGAIAFLVIISCQGFAQPAGSGLGEKVYRSLDFSALPEEFRNTCEPMLFSVRFHINDIGKMDSVEYSTNMGLCSRRISRDLCGYAVQLAGLSRDQIRYSIVGDCARYDT